MSSAKADKVEFKKGISRTLINGKYKFSDIVKHSSNIIDLIEVGDYVNGSEVLDKHIPRDTWEPIELRIDSKYVNFIIADDIKTILTKEVYERNCYKVEE